MTAKLFDYLKHDFLNKSIESFQTVKFSFELFDCANNSTWVQSNLKIAVTWKLVGDKKKHGKNLMFIRLEGLFCFHLEKFYIPTANTTSPLQNYPDNKRLGVWKTYKFAMIF